MGVVEILIKAKDLTGAAFASTKIKLAAMKTSVGKVQNSYMTLGTKISSVMSAALMPIMLVVAAVYSIGRAVGAVTGQFGEFESAMKGVQKTTGMSDEEIDALGDDFKELSRYVPKSATELAEIGKVAGQLGIEGADNINAFTQTVAEASVAFDMDAADAALGLAALVKIYGKTIPEATNLGSAVNALGNTTGASEEQILRFTTSLGPSAEMLGFTAGEAMGMGATLIELKMDASAAGTQMNSAFTIMGQKIPQVSEFLGISEQAFKDAFGEAPLNMLINVIEKIKEIEDPLDQNTQATAIFGRIGAKSIRGLMKDTGRLTENVNKATEAYEAGTAMHEEYLVFAGSYESKLELIKNKANLAAVAIGEKLAPAILTLGNALTDTVIPGLWVMGEEIGKQTEETWPNFKTAVSEAFGKLVGDTNLVTWENIMTGLGVAIGTALNAIMIGLEFIIEANGPFLVAIGGLVTCLTEFVSDIQNLSVKEAFSNLKDNIFTALGNIKDEIGSKLSPIVDAIVTGLGKVKGKAGTIFEGVKDTIFTKLGSIKEGLGEILDPVKTAIHDKLVGIKDGLADKLAPVTTVVLDALSKIKEGLDPVLDPVKTAIHDKLGGIKDGLEEKLAPVKGAIEGVFTSAVGIIELAFADLPAAIGTIFTTIGNAITTFGENLPGFLGSGVEDLGAKFVELGDSFVIPVEDIKEDAATATTHIGIVGSAVETMLGAFDNAPAKVAQVPAATETMAAEVEKDLDKVTLTVDGVELSFDGLKGKVGDVVTEFGNFEDIAGDLIDLDWSVFTTLKEQLPDIDTGINDMKDAFGELKKVLDKNIENLETIQTDLGDIEAVISPFVDDLAPGISAIGDFATALSDTQSALSTFASMSTVDLKGMFGFSTAVHSMVWGLEILDGQMGRLMPSFTDMTTLIRSIADTFVYSGGRSEELTGKIYELNDAFQAETEGVYDARYALYNYLKVLSYTGEGNLANIAAGELTRKYMKRFEEGTEDATEVIHDFLDENIVLETGLNSTTGALKHQTTQLSKISDAIQPLIGFLGTLGTLMELTLGEDAIIPDLEMLDEAFASIEQTMLNLGTALQTVDLAAPITQVMKDSEGFRTSMAENGGELTLLMSYIDTLMGFYIDLGEQLVHIGKLQEEAGESGLDLGAAFGNIKNYIDELISFTPILAGALGDLKSVWDDNSEAVNGGMDAFINIVGAIGTVQSSMGDLITSEGILQSAAEDATGAVDDEADALAGHSLSTSLDTTAASSALLQAATYALAGAMGPLTGAVSAAAGALSGELVGALGAAASAMASLAGGAYSSGAAIGYSFAAGISSAAGAVEAASSDLASIVGSYLGAHSNTELGALSDLMEWGPAIVRTVEEGMRGEMGSLSKALNNMLLGGISMRNVISGEMVGLSKALKGMPLDGVSMGSVVVSSGGGKSTKKVSITINQNISSRADADYAIKEIERLMKKPSII